MTQNRTGGRVLAFRAVTKFALAMICSCLASGCAYRELADRIEVLDREIEFEQAALTQAVGDNRARADSGFQIDLSGEPLVQTLRLLDGTDRRIRYESVDRGGWMVDATRRCPFSSRRYGLRIRPQSDTSIRFYARLGRTNPRWTPRGLEFDFDPAAAGGALMGVRYYACFLGNTDGPPLYALAFLPPGQETDARLHFNPTSRGIEYDIRLERRPAYILQSPIIPGGLLPLRIDEKLTDGTIENIYGDIGEIELGDGSAVRRFRNDFVFSYVETNSAGFLVGGTVDSEWTDD